MIAGDFNSLCKQAELYYYDFLSNESREPVPEFIVNHIRRCRHCRKQVNQLDGVLSQAEGYVEPGQSQVSCAAAALLKLHFTYTGKSVTCNTVKPFLPSLLEPALEVRIPTPITAHLDNCPRCSEDLDTIRELNLGREQMLRLSRLFAEKPGEDNVSCSQAQTAILAVVSMAFHETDSETLKHLCICPDCRSVLYQYRETVRKEYIHNGAERENFPCETVSASDIFDYAVPYGLDPANDQYAGFRQSLTSHLCACPTCLAKIQQLHSTIYNIAERVESEVVTIYHIDNTAKVTGESDDLYAGFPIRVEIANREDKVKIEQPARTIDFAAALKQKVSAKKLKPLLKTGIAAAAVIFIGLALFLHIPAAKAVTLDRIYKAIEKIKNVHISSFVPDKKEPIQEQWVSRTANTYILKTENESVLWDFQNCVRKSKQSGADSVATSLLSSEMIIKIKETVDGFWGLVPFDDLSVIPKDADWSPVTNKGLKLTDDVEIYDLTWTVKTYDGSVSFRKWRVFIDLRTNLPKRTEFYRKSAGDIEHRLVSIKVVEYLSDIEMQKVIKEASF